jgi:hypothetical protein
MFFQQESGQLLADQNRHILPLRERHQFLLALAFEHPPKGRVRPLSPSLLERFHLAIHGIPPFCVGSQLTCTF